MRLIEGSTYINIVVKLYSPRAVKFNLFQRLSNDIVWLPLGVLGGLDDCRLVYVAFVVDIELSEGVLQLEDLILLELRVLSKHKSAVRAFPCACDWLTFGA